MPGLPTRPEEPVPPPEFGAVYSEQQLAGGVRLRRKHGLTAVSRAMARSYAARAAATENEDEAADSGDTPPSQAIRDQHGRWILPAVVDAGDLQGQQRQRTPGLPMKRISMLTGTTPGKPAT